MTVTVHHGDSREVLKGFADASIDSVVCDPPYALVSIGKRFGAENAAPAKAGKSGAYARASAGFMGQKWDTGETAFDPEFWVEVLRVLKPGGHLIAFSGTRTYHRLASAIEDAGFEMRDMIAWLYGSGFPKSHDVSKGIDKAAGAVRAKVRVDAADLKNPPNMLGGVHSGENDRPWREAAMANGFHEKDGDEPATDAARQWQGWGTALKPALEPVVLARKPLGQTVAANVLQHGTGALNIDASRIAGESTARQNSAEMGCHGGNVAESYATGSDKGRWPANVIHDGSEEVVGAFPETASNNGAGSWRTGVDGACLGHYGETGRSDFAGDSGSAARFFYSAKADAADRCGSKHPTVKPVDLMAYLVRMVTPPGGLTLDPFAGSGTTGVGAMREGMRCVLIEREDAYVEDIVRKLAWARGEGRLTTLEQAKLDTPEAQAKAGGADLPLFGDA
jgi:DNA modification methylase